jgi:hypothetical protein
MKNTMSDQMKKILDERRLKGGGLQSLWEVPLINEEQIHKLNFKERFLIRTKLWLRDWYPIFTIILGGLSIIYYIVQILKALK